MLLKTRRHEQYIVLIAGNIDINHSSLKHRHQHIIVATEYDDILTKIELTQFDLILIDLTTHYQAASVSEQLQHSSPPWVEEIPKTDGNSLGHHHRQPELLTRIKDPLGLNSKTPVIAIINPIEDTQSNLQCPNLFDDYLTGPITEQQLNEVIDLWQTKALAQDYVQIILSKTKNNQRLTLTLFEKLFEELPLQIIGIKNALENRQYDVAQEITHKLNGSVSFCGLIDIQQPANALEACLLTNNYASTDRHFLMLQQSTLNFTRHQKFILANLGKY